MFPSAPFIWQFKKIKALAGEKKMGMSSTQRLRMELNCFRLSSLIQGVLGVELDDSYTTLPQYSYFLRKLHTYII